MEFGVGTSIREGLVCIRVYLYTTSQILLVDDFVFLRVLVEGRYAYKHMLPGNILNNRIAIPDAHRGTRVQVIGMCEEIENSFGRKFRQLISGVRDIWDNDIDGAWKLKKKSMKLCLWILHVPDRYDIVKKRLLLVATCKLLGWGTKFGMIKCKTTDIPHGENFLGKFSIII